MANDYDCQTLIEIAKASHKLLQTLVNRSKFSQELKDDVAFWNPVFEEKSLMQIRAQCGQLKQKLVGDKNVEKQLSVLIGLLDAAIKAA